MDNTYFVLTDSTLRKRWFQDLIHMSLIMVYSISQYNISILYLNKRLRFAEPLVGPFSKIFNNNIMLLRVILNNICWKHKLVNAYLEKEITLFLLVHFHASFKISTIFASIVWLCLSKLVRESRGRKNKLTQMHRIVYNFVFPFNLLFVKQDKVR